MSDQRSELEQVGVLDAVIVGAGFAGMYMLHRLRGMGLSVRVFEAGGVSAAPGIGIATQGHVAT